MSFVLKLFYYFNQTFEIFFQIFNIRTSHKKCQVSFIFMADHRYQQFIFSTDSSMFDNVL